MIVLHKCKGEDLLKMVGLSCVCIQPSSSTSQGWKWCNDLPTCYGNYPHAGLISLAIGVFSFPWFTWVTELMIKRGFFFSFHRDPLCFDTITSVCFPSLRSPHMPDFDQRDRARLDDLKYFCIGKLGLHLVELWI